MKPIAMKSFAQIFSVALLTSCVTVAFAGGGGGGRGGRGAGGAGAAGGGGRGGAAGGGFNNGAGGAQLQNGAGGGRGAVGVNLAGTLGLNVNFYTDEYSTMLRQLTLTEDQKPKVKEKADAMNVELQAFLLSAQSTAGRGARGGRGAAAGAAPGLGSTLTAEQLKIREDYLTLADQHQLKIDSELTSEQKVQWETYKVNLFLAPKLQEVTLSDDQKDKMKLLVTDTAKAIAQLTDGKDIENLMGRMYRKIMTDILTEPQIAWLLEAQPAIVGPVGQLAAGGLGGVNGNAAGNVGGGNGNFAAGGGRGGRGAGAAGAAGGGFGAGGAGGGGRGGRGGGFGGGGGGAPAAGPAVNMP